MGPESFSSREASRPGAGTDPSTYQDRSLRLETPAPGDPNWVIFGSQGLRAGWSIAVFAFLLFFFSPICGTILSFLVYDVGHLTVFGLCADCRADGDTAHTA